MLEFDLDAALARRPALILVDELAHTNAPGSRHPKRWQDVEELLAAGIDVYTTLNVQHLESLNDVVGGITGVRVGETVPDTVFDAADEVVLVDLPPDELLPRLKAGKVYLPDQAERAGRNFFRKGNLIALRELALRRTADRVDDDVRAYRVEQSIDPVWSSGAALLACIGPGADAERVVRSAARLAGQLGAGWHAVYVETPALQRLPPAQRERILQTLKLAGDLGATHRCRCRAIRWKRRWWTMRAATTWRASPSGAAVASAPWRTPRSRRIARAGARHRTDRSRRDAGEFGPARRHARRGAMPPDAGAPPGPRPARHRRPGQHRHGAGGHADRAATSTSRTSPCCSCWWCVLAAVRLGRGPSVTATCVGVACFDFFFVPPRFTFAVSDVQYLVTFGVMLAVGLITGHLTAGCASRRGSPRTAKAGRARCTNSRATLSGVLQIEQISRKRRAPPSRAAVRRAQRRCCCPMPTAGCSPPATPKPHVAGARSAASPSGPSTTAPAPGAAPTPCRAARCSTCRWWRRCARAACWRSSRTKRAGCWCRNSASSSTPSPRWPRSRSSGCTISRWRSRPLVSMESERLRNSLLAALSHDLRTPLTALVALAESLAQSAPPLAPAQRGMADALREESGRMSTLVTNLLDMARIESGAVKLRLQWQPIEEVVGSALRASRAALARHVVRTLPAELPLVNFDAVLIERVLCNLLENAGKYTPAGSTITIARRAARRCG